LEHNLGLSILSLSGTWLFELFKYSYLIVMNFLLKRIKTHDKGYDFGQKFLFVVNIKTTINDKEILIHASTHYLQVYF